MESEWQTYSVNKSNNINLFLLCAEDQPSFDLDQGDNDAGVRSELRECETYQTLCKTLFPLR